MGPQSPLARSRLHALIRTKLMLGSWGELRSSNEPFADIGERGCHARPDTFTVLEKEETELKNVTTALIC